MIPEVGFKSMDTASILVIEDEPEIRELLRFTLSRAGYEIQEAESAEDAFKVVERRLPDLMVVDWMLPGISGIEFLRRMREDDYASEVPKIMLTARGEEASKLKGFVAGVDDYITKPFSTRELLARIKALLRRAGSAGDEELTGNGIVMSMSSHEVRVDGDAVHLRPTEYRLLQLLMKNPRRAFSRSQILDRLWGRSAYVDERTVDVHVLRLRKALREFNRESSISTVRGVGYRFCGNLSKD